MNIHHLRDFHHTPRLNALLCTPTVPSNILLRKVGARYWLASIVLAFGAIMTGMAYVTSWEQLAVCRVLLGVAEAGCECKPAD